METVLLRYHELALKGDNRGYFEARLASNIRKTLKKALGETAPVELERFHGRLLVHMDLTAESRDALQRVFGIAGFSPVRRVTTDKQRLAEAAVEEASAYFRKNGFPEDFRVLTRRSEKALPESSVELDHFIGGAVKEAFPQLRVKLKDPQFTLGVEVRNKESFLWTEKIPANGGLPVGCNGRVLTLVSGGLDSPVAAIQVLRRGSPTSFVHFYGAPFVGEEVLEKIRDLVEIINRYQPDAEPLFVVPFGKIQEKIAVVTNPKMRTLLYRRMMIRIANRLGQKVKAQALITGESLGQVASQTLENLVSIDSVTEIPILRPLITYNKDEIIAAAQKWGTYETSIRPGLDCCTLFADRHPTLRSSISVLEGEERKFSVQQLVDEALAGIEIVR